MASGVTKISLLSFSNFADTTARLYAEGGSLVNDLEDARSLYQVEDISAGTGDRRVYLEMDGQTYARLKAEGEDATKSQVIKGYNVTMTARRFAAEVDITFEARRFGKDQEIIKKLTALSTFIPQRQALDLTHRFTFAASTSYTDMDGESVDIAMGDSYALAYATHTLAGSSTTYSTVITGNPAFSEGGFEVARAAANTQMLNNFGERRVFNFNTVVTGDDPATVREVRTLLQSTASPDGINSGVTNTYRGLFRHVILPRMATSASGAYDSTKTKYWAYVAAGEFEAHLGIFEAPNLKMPATSNNGEDIHSDDWTFGTRGTYGIAIVSSKGCLHSTGAGA